LDTRHVLALTAAAAMTAATGGIAASAELGLWHKPPASAAAARQLATGPSVDAADSTLGSPQAGPTTAPSRPDPSLAEGPGRSSGSAGSAGPAPIVDPSEAMTEDPNPAAGTVHSPSTVTTSTFATTRPPTTTTRVLGPTATTAVFMTRGGEGTVQVSCTSRGAITLVSATPAAGYRAQVGDTGPEKVEVRFVTVAHGGEPGDEQVHDAELQVSCSHGQPVIER
jgi:hypothetical protein